MKAIPTTVSLVFSAAVLAGGCATSRTKIADDVSATIGAEAATTPDARRVAEVQAEAKKDVRVREAFHLGQLQATKAMHQAILNTQKTDAPDANPLGESLVPLTIPERKVDGVIVNQGVEYVRLPR